MNKKIKEKLLIILITIILSIINILLAVTYSNAETSININEYIEFTIDFEEPIITSDFSISYDTEKLTYIGSSTENLKTNYIQENSKMYCSYYDINKIGTNKITLKFKANKETNKTQIKVTNITAHTNTEEKQLQDLTENIKIIKQVENNSETTNKTEISNNVTNNVIDNIINDTIDKNPNSNTEKGNKIEQNTTQIKDNTTSSIPIPKTGIGLDLMYIVVIIITILLCRLIIKNEKLTKSTKVTFTIIIILLGIIALSSRYVFAQNEDKILINKNGKNILVVLSTSNENRNMTTQYFKEKTKATSIASNNELIIKSGEIATFKNNEKYNISIYGDENSNGIVNSSDIFELISKENIDIAKIEEISNFIIKKEELKNYLSLPSNYEEFNENSIITPNTTPLQPAIDRYKAVKNIEELQKLDAKVGEKYKTLGYYEENDGGAGRYDIIENSKDIKIDNGLYIQLDNGLIAKLAIINNTVNVKQFGAKGNKINDDTTYLNTAFNSGVENVEMPIGEYKITDVINMATQNTNVIGNSSTIFTDNDYKPKKYSEFLFIMNTDNCSINNLKIEARETKNLENIYCAQVYIGASNIKVLNCSFKIPETASSEHGYNNLDLYTAWHDVLIDNCELYLANDAKSGGCIWVRDLFNRGASNLTFTNNKCYKKTHDEILAVFMGTIENVNILNNTFTMAESQDPSTMAFTFGSGSSKKADNIKFEGNTVDVKTTMDLFVSRNTNNLSIKNNKMKFERVTTKTNTFVMYFPESNVQDAIIEDNEIEIQNNTGTAINGLLSSNSKNITFNKNKLNVNGNVSEAFSGGIINTNNNITFNGEVNILVNKPREYNGNNITFNNRLGAIVQYYVGAIDWNSNIKNNIFEINFEETESDRKSIILMFNGGSLNNHFVTFDGNTVKYDKGNTRANLIYLLNLQDQTPQTINITNNTISGYRSGWKSPGQIEHILKIKNN